MRKRDRDRMVSRLKKIADDHQSYVTNQLHGSIWYFENNAEGKGISFGLAASGSMLDIGKRLELLLNPDAKTKTLKKKGKSK